MRPTALALPRSRYSSPVWGFELACFASVGVDETLRVLFASRRNGVPADSSEIFDFRDTRNRRFLGTSSETRRVSDGLHRSFALVNAVSPPLTAGFCACNRHNRRGLRHRQGVRDGVCGWGRPRFGRCRRRGTRGRRRRPRGRNASIVPYLASEQSGYITGQVVGVTGGIDPFSFRGRPGRRPTRWRDTFLTRRRGTFYP